MRYPSLALGSVLTLVIAACASAPPTTPSSPAPLASQAAVVPSGTPVAEAATSAPIADQGQSTEAPRPTITINPRLHATNPQHVKLASGDQPTLVEFFAFW